jgi:hypothetical protein
VCGDIERDDVMASIGDKYIVEIQDTVFMGKLFYTFKDFPKILLSDYDLDILEKYEPTHVAGPADGHDLPEFIYGMSSKDKQIHLGRVTWQ